MTSGGKILIVDDSEESLKLLSEILSAEGYEVRPADSGELALAAVTASRPELILLDMSMPGISGLDVCRKLKLDAESREIPIIFLSASLEFEDRIEGLESGAVDFINKPFRREELLARLKTHLELAQLRAGLEQRVAERTADLQVANNNLNGELEMRRRTEAELRESEQRFRSIADTVPVGIWMTTPAGGVTYASQWISTFSGWNMEQLAGSGWIGLLHPEDVQSKSREVVALLQEHSAFEREYRFRRSDGEYRWLVKRGIPRFVEGEFAGFLGSLLDITEMKRSQEQALANQKLESLGVLAGGIAHDFGNLLSTILAHSDLALSEIPNDSPAHENISTIAMVALRASEIVKLLVDYAGHTDPYTSEQVELTSLIEELVQLLRVSIPRATSLQMKLSKDLPAIQANSAQIRQVVLNLIVNASEALEAQRGTVTVSTSRVRVSHEASESRSAHLAEGDYVLLEVSDTGCGMTEEVKARIFDPFYSTKSLGRGMGLASVQGIARGLGAAISVNSARGKGSTFKIWLRASECNPQKDGGTSPQGSNSRPTVLLVDDEEELRIAVSSALKQEGFSVLETHDGLAAVQLFAAKSDQISVAVLDLDLPGLSGYDLYEEIRRLKTDARVLFTSVQEPAGMDGTGRQTNQRFLQKPYRLRELIQTVREMMASSSAL